MNYEFNVTMRLTYMFVIASVLLLVFTFLFGLHLGESIARESLSNSTPLVTLDAVVGNPAATGEPSVGKASGVVEHAQSAATGFGSFPGSGSPANKH